MSKQKRTDNKGKTPDKTGYFNKRSNQSTKGVPSDVAGKSNRRDGSAPNDPFWYGATPEIIRDTASLSYGYPLGRPIDVGGSDVTFMPGVMAFAICPAIGQTITGAEAPVNMAAQNIYGFVIHANSRNASYDPPDLMLYLLAMDQLYSMYSWGCRIYGLIRQYNHVNRYWPRAILETELIDYDDFAAHIADFRYFLDIFAKKIGSLCVPNSMPYFKRHVQLFEQVYMDAPVLKSQLYVYTPWDFWQYDELSGPGRLVPAGLRGSGVVTYNQFTTIARNMLNAVIDSQDCGIMSGDILKAFGAENAVRLSMVPIEYETPIIYSPEMLSQIQNATITDIGMHIVSQSGTNNLLNIAYVDNITTSPNTDDHKILTMVREDVSPLDTIVATRLTSFIAASGTSFGLVTVGSEYVSLAILGFLDASNTFTTHILNGSMELDASSPGTLGVGAVRLELLSKFNQHPMIRVVVKDSSGVEFMRKRLQDIDNYTVIEAPELEEMNEGALLSQFNVPQMGLWATKT